MPIKQVRQLTLGNIWVLSGDEEHRKRREREGKDRAATWPIYLPMRMHNWGNRQYQKPARSASPNGRMRAFVASALFFLRSGKPSSITSCRKSMVRQGDAQMGRVSSECSTPPAPSALNRDLIGTSPAIRMLVIRASARERETQQRRRLATDRGCRWPSVYPRQFDGAAACMCSCRGLSWSEGGGDGRQAFCMDASRAPRSLKFGAAVRAACVTPIPSFYEAPYGVAGRLLLRYCVPILPRYWPGHVSFVRVGLRPPHVYLASHTYMDLHVNCAAHHARQASCCSSIFMYWPAKSMPLNASVPRARASCTPRCLNGPCIAQSPVKTPEPNTVGKLEGDTMFVFAGMAFSRKGKARRVFQSQPIGQTLFSRPLSMQRPLAFKPALAERNGPMLIRTSSCWFGGATWKGSGEEQSSSMIQGTPSKRVCICKGVGNPTRGGKGAGDALRPDIQDPVAPLVYVYRLAGVVGSSYCRSPASGSRS
ncbi:uncharacterized protein TRIVIDRAFT_66837 [Trichoderma virens Gv29-8]|uniref:Uncharacterized protein n=1 Tax=Hypocrea virens (strain Gv29-8 / FGSC 10586) TaxID=413071 RepID=G9N3C4_HYPVG|nr:uncharacterized protein TRIVIDRAFT_66837 [Trichoderma virens Gv29-8]EHK18808.1 hypothetical protein TRIVIDRAFT_66837 [Trichoderma virens Gv29-8]